MVAIVRKRNRQRGQENHAKIKKNNNGQIMYMYICLKLVCTYVFLFPHVRKRMCVSACVCSRKQHITIAHTILYSPSKMQFGGWLISNLWFMGDSLC